MSDDARRSVGVRVRPNSHDFIRQLRSDLASKQATFYVDVRAKTTKATGDVRKWAATDLKQIVPFLNVRANTGPATRDVAEWRRRQEGIITTVKVKADTSQAIRQIEAVRNMARDITVKVKADPSLARDQIAKDAQRGLIPDAASKRNAKLTAQNFQKALVELNIGDSLSKSISENLDRALKTKKARIDVDATPARATMRELLDKFSTEAADISVDLDTKPAEGRAAELKKNLELRNVKLQADIDLRKVRTELAEFRLKQKLDALEIDVRVKKSGVDKLSETLRGIEKGVGNLTVLRSLDLGPLTLGKPTGLIGTLTTITALAGAVPGAVTGLAALSDVIVRLGGAAALAPGAIGALAASMATLSVGTIGVSDTFSALFGMWTEGASKSDKFADSVNDEAKAQRAVTSARRESLHELRDLNNELKDGVLNEAQSLLDLQKARDRLAKGGFDNETERLQAVLDVKKAEQGLTETRETNLKTQEKAAEANAKGVEGSDRVQDALAAQQKATKDGTDAQVKFNDALANLSPNAQEFFKTLAGMKGQMMGFKNDIQDTIFQGTAPAFEDLFKEISPVVKPGMEAIAKGLNQNLLAVFDTVKSPDGKTIIERILGGTADTQKAITNLINPLINGIGTLVAAGSEHLPQIINLFTQLATRFTNFINEADRDGSLDTFFNKGVTALSDLADTGINAIKIINDLSTAFGGQGLIKNLSDATEKLHQYLASAEGQAKLNELFDRAKKIWNDWKPALEKLPGIFDAVSTAASGVMDAVGPFLKEFTQFLKDNPDLVKGFITGWLGAKVLTGALSPFLGLLKTATSTAQLLFTVFGKIPGVAALVARATTGLASILPGGPGILTTPGTTAPLAAAGGSAVGTAAGVAGLFAAPLVIAGGAALAMTSQIPQDYSASKEQSDAFVADVNKKLPQGVPAFGSQEAENFITGAAAQGSPAGKWLDSTAVGGGGVIERAKRYLWLATQPNVSDLLASGNFTPPPAGSYMTGGHHTGYTPWGAKQGKMAELHGGEFVEPKHVVDHYGLDAMEAIRQKKVPKQFLGSYDEGGLVYDPTTGQYVPAGTSVSHGVNPANQGNPGIIGTLTSGAAGIASAFAQEAVSAAPAAPGMGTGPLPGPAIPPADGATPSHSPFANAFLSAVGIPGLTNQAANDQGAGWPSGSAPLGLGGGPPGPNGEAPFDIRKYGIGPGPMGSGPNDWMAFTGKTLGKFGSSFISTLASGLLDSAGISGVSKNLTQFSPILNHILNPDDVQGPGAGQTNADVNSLLATASSMPGNPAYPGAPGLPGVFNPGTGTALNPKGAGNGGLQINTLKGKAAIQAAFPWATNIGGVRADKLKWHPEGLALDVMIPGEKGLNDPTTPHGLALGNQLYAWLNDHKSELGIDYLMWQVPDHHNHIHVNFASSGYPDGGQSSVAPQIAGPATPGAKPWFPGGGRSAPAGTNVGGGQSAPAATNVRTSPFDPSPIPVLTRDNGGWLPTGVSLVRNFTGKPELVTPHSQIPSFQAGGYNFPQGAVPLPPPRPPDIIKMTPPPKLPPVAQPKPLTPIVPSPPSGGGNFDPVSPGAVAPGSPPPPQQQQIPGAVYPPLGPQTVPTAPSDRPIPKVGDNGDHVHPALRKGITSGFATAGSLASMAINAAAAAGTFGAAGAAGGAGGGGIGSMVQGLFTQAGKIANNVANVASSFLVGNITGGTTANPYGVTQRGSVPTGGNKMVDASNNQYGDIYTQDLDSYFARVDRRDAQRAQSTLGRWGNE